MPTNLQSSQPTHIDQLNAVNVVIGDGARQIVIQDGQPIELPSRDDLLTYLAAVQERYSRWADVEDPPDPPLFARGENPEDGPDAYIPTQAQTLPMRVAEFRPQVPAGEREPESLELLAALGQSPRTIILGEPGSGKTTALERLAWTTATTGLDQPQPRLALPILARLADFMAQDGLLGVLRRAVNQDSPFQLNDISLRLLLWARDVDFVILLDGLNELPQAQAEAGLTALRGYLADYPRHTVHLTCRTADFDPNLQAPPQALMAQAPVWTVQPLSDNLRYWGDEQGQSDVADYLRRHLGADAGKRLYEGIRADDRLRDLARLPLFLFMFKESGAEGELPRNRGELVQGFIHSRRVLGKVPEERRAWVARSFAQLGWRMQQAGALEIDGDDLEAILVQVRGQRSYPLEQILEDLRQTGLLIYLGSDGFRERYRLLHQFVQEYAAAAYLVHQAGDCREQLPALARQEWWRESCILALWLRPDLHTPAFLQTLMTDPAVDLRVRITAADLLADVGDPRFPAQERVWHSALGGSGTRRMSVKVILPDMVEIPGGLATLGGPDPDASDDETPLSRVAVAPFALARYPVTNAEYRCFLQAGGYEDESLWTPAGRLWLRGEGKLDLESDRQYRQIHQALRADVEGMIAQIKGLNPGLSDQEADGLRTFATWDEDRFVQFYAGDVLGEQRREPVWWDDSRFNRDTQPVVGVNWYEALAYAEWLSRVTGQAYCLPTEAQWEWAARRYDPDQPQTRQDRRYPWGDEWDVDRCNSALSRVNQATPVGLYPHGATPDGLYDLAGNVYEWTTTLYRPYPYAAGDGREEVTGEGLRVMRGGAWYVGPAKVRCASRHGYDPWYGFHFTGFRLARLLSL